MVESLKKSEAALQNMDSIIAMRGKHNLILHLAERRGCHGFLADGSRNKISDYEQESGARQIK